MTVKPFNGEERRAYVRLERSLAVRFKIYTEQLSKIYTGKTKNISQGGLCLEIQQDSRQLLENLSGADLKVHVDLDTLIPPPSTAVSTKPAWINSRVDWSRKPTAKDQAMLIGLEFESVTDEARKRIHDYIVEEFVKGYEKHD